MEIEKAVLATNEERIAAGMLTRVCGNAGMAGKLSLAIADLFSGRFLAA